MNKSEIVTKLETIQDRSALAMVNAFLAIIEDCLVKGEDVKIANFGKFEVRDHRAVEKRNPRTGETIFVPPKRAVGFKPATALRQRVNPSAE